MSVRAQCPSWGRPSRMTTSGASGRCTRRRQPPTLTSMLRCFSASSTAAKSPTGPAPTMAMRRRLKPLPSASSAGVIPSVSRALCRRRAFVWLRKASRSSLAALAAATAARAALLAASAAAFMSPLSATLPRVLLRKVLTSERSELSALRAAASARVASASASAAPCCSRSCVRTRKASRSSLAPRFFFACFRSRFLAFFRALASSRCRLRSRFLAALTGSTGFLAFAGSGALASGGGTGLSDADAVRRAAAGSAEAGSRAQPPPSCRPVPDRPILLLPSSFFICPPSSSCSSLLPFPAPPPGAPPSSSCSSHEHQSYISKGM
mmetsp:Transcript_13933/g.30186  ORF Transcript_13933/g.30186 Transcript_13933/m.30186 type:complete len:323 (+) Transcript_13933:579-1547(+)